jgi:hypothetical protein
MLLPQRDTSQEAGGSWLVQQESLWSDGKWKTLIHLMLYRLQSSTPSTNTNNFDGTAGTSVGSSIGGLARRSGGKMGRNHCLYLPAGPMNTMHHRHIALASTQLSIPWYASLSKVLGKLWSTMALHHVSTRTAQHTKLVQTAGTVTYKPLDALSCQVPVDSDRSNSASLW